MKWYNVSWILIFLCVPLLLGAGERIALIPFGEDDRSVAELAAVYLTESDPELELLERSELEEVHRELRLDSDSGSFTLRPGLIRNADLLCILEDGLICFDVRSGIRIEETELSGGETAEKAFQASQFILEAVKRKKTLPALETKVAVSVLPFLAVNLTPVQERIGRSAATAVRRSLLRKTNVILLERQYLLEALREPEQEQRGLLRELAPSALILRLEGRPAGKEALLLSARLETPDGTVAAHWEGEVSDRTPLPENLFAEFQMAPPDTAGTESAKAFQQAGFIFSHGGIREAVELAAAGTALDSRKAADLAGMIFHAIFDIGNHLPAGERGAFYVRALSCAVPIAEKQNTFYFWAMRAMGSCFSPAAFRGFSEQEQRSIRELIVRLIRKANDLEQERIRRWADSPPADRHNIRTQSLNFMHELLCNLWDLSLYEQYVVPELERFIRETNLRADEIEKQIDCRAASATGPRDGAVFDLLERSSLGKDFFKREGDDDLAVKNRVFHLLEQSEFLHLAARGYVGEWKHNGKLACGLSLEEALIRCFERCRFPDSNREYFDHITWEIPWRTNFTLSDILIRRFGYYLFLRNGMLVDLRDVTREEAETLHRKLFSYYNGIKEDPRCKLSEETRNSLRRQLLADMRRLEEKFRIPPLVPPDKNFPYPFEPTILPLKELNLSGRPSNPAFDGRYFYFALLDSRSDQTRMFRLDTRNHFAAEPGAALPGSSWYGGNMLSVLTTDYYLVLNGPSGFLFPRDCSGVAARKIDFSGYYQDSWNAVAAVGDRVFLSCGKWAGTPKPGTVLEYNLRTGNLKLIVSTLDRSVEWPMKKFQKIPYHIHELAVDLEHKEILMLMHTGTFAQGWSAPPMMIWGYQYETGKWVPRSGRLPVFFGAYGRFQPDHGGIMLIIDGLGFGPIAADGRWTPSLLLAADLTTITSTVPKRIGSRDKFDLDDSSPVHFRNMEFNRSCMETNTLRFGEDLLVGRNELYLIPEKIRYTFRNKEFHSPFALMGRYLVEVSAYSDRPDALKIIPMKERQEILRLFEENQ